jgi:hypothetical protein
MADLTLCTNFKCPLSNTCWRHNCIGAKDNQYYQEFEPTIDSKTGKASCDFYLEKITKQTEE